jgi:hypothetical protein
MILLIGIPLGPVSKDDPAVPVLRNLPPRPPWFTSLCAKVFGKKEVACVSGVLLTYHVWRGVRYLTGFEYLGSYAHDVGEDYLTLEPDKKHLVFAPNSFVYRRWVEQQRFVKYPRFMQTRHQLAGYDAKRCVLHVLAGSERNEAYRSSCYYVLVKRGAEVRFYSEDDTLTTAI